MAKKVFLSFRYKEDVRRVSQIKQIGALEEQPLLDSNDWEKVKRGGNKEIEAWIAREMKGKKCLIVLIGSATAGRKWVNHEIKKAWTDGLGVVGVRIHGLKDPVTGVSRKGPNPFDDFTLGDKKMSSVVKTYDPFGPNVYKSIQQGIEGWVDEAIRIRNAN